MDFLVANIQHDLAPPPPPGYVRSRGSCARCQRTVVWITFRPSACQPCCVIVCGFCARDLLLDGRTLSKR